MVVENLVRDCFSPCYDNSDQVLIEVKLLQGLSTFLVKENPEETNKIFSEISTQLQEAIAISPEVLSVVSLLTALCFD
jgi:hypothetical protein